MRYLVCTYLIIQTKLFCYSLTFFIDFFSTSSGKVNLFDSYALGILLSSKKYDELRMSSSFFFSLFFISTVPYKCALPYSIFSRHPVLIYIMLTNQLPLNPTSHKFQLIFPHHSLLICQTAHLFLGRFRGILLPTPDFHKM